MGGGRGDGAGAGRLELTVEGSTVLGDVCPGEGGQQQRVVQGSLDDAPGVLANDIPPPA